MLPCTDTSGYQWWETSQTSFQIYLQIPPHNIWLDSLTHTVEKSGLFTVWLWLCFIIWLNMVCARLFQSSCYSSGIFSWLVSIRENAAISAMLQTHYRNTSQIRIHNFCALPVRHFGPRSVRFPKISIYPACLCVQDIMFIMLACIDLPVCLRVRLQWECHVSVILVLDWLKVRLILLLRQNGVRLAYCSLFHAIF